MADIALQAAADAANSIQVVAPPLLKDKPTRVANVAITAGQAVATDPTTGNMALALADTAPHAALYQGIAWRDVAAGQAITVFKSGIFDGFDLSGMNYGDKVYLSNTAGALSTTAGTSSLVVGEVIDGRAVLLGNAPDKLLRLY